MTDLGWPASYDNDGNKLSPPGPQIVRMSDVKPERVAWLWPGWVPAGRLEDEVRPHDVGARGEMLTTRQYDHTGRHESHSRPVIVHR